MQRISAKFQKYYDWMLEDKDARMSRRDFMHENHVSVMQIAAYEEAYQKPPDVDFAEQVRIMDNELFEAAKKTNAIAQMKQLWYTRHGLLTQKTENKNLNVNVTGDQYADIEREAKRRNLEEGFTGEGEVQGQPDLLSQEIRQGTG